MYSSETEQRLSSMGDRISKKDPNHTKITQGPIKPIKKGDTEADILAKLYNFMFADCKNEKIHKKELDNSKQLEDKLELERDMEIQKAISGKEKSETKSASGVGLLGLLGLGLIGLTFSKDAFAKFVGHDFDKLFDLNNQKSSLEQIRTLFEGLKQIKFDISDFSMLGGDISLTKDAIDPRQVYQYLTETKGIDPIHAMGMMTNIMGESGFVPGALGDKNELGQYTSGGLFQHHNERFTKMVEFAGPNWQKDWKKQIDYALSEPESKQYLSTTYTSETEATGGFVRQFEKSKHQERDISKRIGFISGIKKKITQDISQSGTDKLYSPAPKESMQRVVGHVGEHRKTHDHQGVDYAMPEGTQISAATGGIVRTGFQKGGAGQYITITGDDGSETKYMHLKRMDVKEGQRVNAGDPIGLSGGKAGAEYSGSSEGPHLHFEYWKNGQLQDPEKMSFLQKEDIQPLSIPTQERKETTTQRSVVLVDASTNNFGGNKTSQYSIFTPSDQPILLQAIYSGK